MPVYAAAKPGRIGGHPLPGRSRRATFQRTREMVFAAARRWDEKSSVTAITGPLLNRADVQAAFDELREKDHIVGIELRFEEPDGGSLQAIFAPTSIEEHRHESRTVPPHATIGYVPSTDLDLRR